MRSINNLQRTVALRNRGHDTNNLRWLYACKVEPGRDVFECYARHLFAFRPIATLACELVFGWQDIVRLHRAQSTPTTPFSALPVLPMSCKGQAEN